MQFSIQKSKNSDKIGSIIDQLIKNSNVSSNNKENVKSIQSKGNNSRVSYLKTATEPKVIFKRESSNVEVEKIELETPDFLYDDEDDKDLSNSKKKKISNKIKVPLNKEKQGEIQPNSTLKPERRSHILNEQSKSDFIPNQKNILPDFVIDEIVYEESESKINLKSSIEELKKKVKSCNDKDKHKFSRLFQEIRNLYNEIEELKKVQEQINRTQATLTRRDNLVNGHFPLSHNPLNLPTPKVCPNTKVSVRYPLQFRQPLHQVNPAIGHRPNININNRYFKPFPPNISFLRKMVPPTHFSSNFNDNVHQSLFKYIH